MALVSRALFVFMALLLGIAALFAAPAMADDATHVDNRLDTAVLATLNYDGGTSKFVNRKIDAGGSDVDVYQNTVWNLKLKVFAPKDGCVASNVGLSRDQSVAVIPIDGGKRQGFTIVDSSAPGQILGVASCP